MNGPLVVKGMKGLVDGLKTNVWPDVFFSELLELSPETVSKLPDWAMKYLIIYAVAALLSILLHYKKKQKSFSNFTWKLADFICMAVAVMCLWIIPQFYRQAKMFAAEVPGEFSWTREGFSWLSEWMQSWFDPVFLGIIFIAIAVCPFMKALRYLREYKLFGIPWAIYDMGFSILCYSAAILAMASGEWYWYAAIPAAMVLVSFGQTGGVDLELSDKPKAKKSKAPKTAPAEKAENTDKTT